MYQLIIDNNGKETPVYVAEDRRLVELVRQRHARSLTFGEAVIRDFEPVKEEK